MTKKNIDKCIEMATLGVNTLSNTATAANFASLTEPKWAAGISSQQLGSLPLSNVLSLVALGAAFYNLVVTVKDYRKQKEIFDEVLQNLDHDLDHDPEEISLQKKQLDQIRFNCVLLLHEFITSLAANVIKLSPTLAPVVGFVVPYIFVAYLAPRLAYSLYQIGKELFLAINTSDQKERSAHYQAAFNHGTTVGLQTLGMLLVVFMMINPISGMGFIPMSLAIDLIALTVWMIMKAVKPKQDNLAQCLKGKFTVFSSGKPYCAASNCLTTKV